MAPTTLMDLKTSTSPQGRDSTMGYPMRMCEIISTLDGPSYVVRAALSNPAGIRNARQAMLKSFQYQMLGRGFTFVEILASCPTYWHKTPKASMAHIDSVLAEAFPVKVFRDKGAAP